MSILPKKFISKVNTARLKTKAIAAGFIITIASIAAIATLGGAAAAPVSTPNCDNNAVVYCGASSVSKLQDKYSNGDGHNSKASVQNIYNYSKFGISSSDVSSMKTDAVAGYVTKSGEVYVGNDSNHTLVATDALTAGRQNISGSTKVTNSGTTFYTRKPSVSFQDGELSAMVDMKNGIFQFAILNSCGNPVSATPKKPNYTISKQVRAGDSGSYGSSVSVKSGSAVEYQITVDSNGQIPVNNVTVHDTLPTGISYTTGSLKENGQDVSTANVSKFFGSGLNVGNIKNGSKDVFIFSAVAGKTTDTDLSCKADMLTNTGFISAPGQSGKQSSAKVSTTCTPPKASSLACSALTAVAGTADSNGNTPYTLKATASASNAAITKYVFTPGDSSADITVNSSATSASTTHTYAPGTFTASVAVSGTDVSGKAVTAAANQKCTATITVKTPECKPGVPMGSPACTPSSLTCVGLSDVPGDVDATTGDQQFTFTGTASADNGTISTYSFDFGDGKAVPVSSSATSATTTHSYAPGTYTATLTVAGKDASGNPAQAPSNPKCSVNITVKTPECKPGVQMGSNECFTYTCNDFTLSLDNEARKATVASFNATSTNPNATLTNVVIDWGDGGTNTVAVGQATSQSHVFTVDSSTVTATAQFTVAGQNSPVTSTTCSQPVSFTTTPTPPQTPPVLPNTGAGDTIAIFLGAMVAGTIGFRMFMARKLSRR